MLGLAIKSTSLARVAASLVETYLGRDAGRRVLAGRMSRGVVEKIHAVLWFSDIRDYTALSEDMASDQLIPLLDDYAEAVISAVHGAGGDVLKLIGDGVLAIFAADDPAAASRSALQAEAGFGSTLPRSRSVAPRRRLPIASIYIGIHIGDVFYGNIGSKDRLDFTVVGEAVNETSRISSMCSSVERDVLFSSAFRAALPDEDKGEAGVDRPLCAAWRPSRAGAVHARSGNSRHCLAADAILVMLKFMLTRISRCDTVLEILKNVGELHGPEGHVGEGGRHA